MHELSAEIAAPAQEALITIGANIRRARVEAFGESREIFAKRLGCSPITLDRIEGGKPGVASIYLMGALLLTQTLSDVVSKTNPMVLIATRVPAEFPPGLL